MLFFSFFLLVSRHKREGFNLHKNEASPREGGGVYPRGASVWPGSFWDPPPCHQEKGGSMHSAWGVSVAWQLLGPSTL